MNTNITQEQIDQYRRDGFVAHRNFLSAEEVTALKNAVLATIEEMGKRKVAEGNENLKEGDDAYYDKVFTQRLNLWRLNEQVKSTMLSPAIGEMLKKLTGHTAGYRAWHDQALIKEPYGNPTSWHLDNPYWSFYSPDSVSIWIALEPATLENGCMWFIPGTHKMARYDNVYIGQVMDDLFKVYPEMAEIDPVAVPMQPGDCSFHNGLTAHGAGANMTRGRRIAMTCAYMPDGATFNGQQNVLPQSYFDTLKEGDILANDECNPKL